MEPKLTHVAPFTVSGLTVRTINRDEFNPGTAKIAGLWGQFFGGAVAEKIPGRLDDATIYGVYSGYESDANGAFDVTGGVAVAAPAPDFTNVEVRDGQYLVFEVNGAMPAAVIQGWMAVWTYFEQHPEVKRSYLTDFEAYTGLEQVKIHIGVAA